MTHKYIKKLLSTMKYNKIENSYERFFHMVDCSIKIDFENEKIIYPEDKGLIVSKKTTCNFSDPENFVVLECITRLLEKGYRPENITLEKEWTLGHEAKSGRADICVSDQNGNMLFIVECKTYGKEYDKELKNIINDGGQLFSYWQQERSCKFLVLYASKFEDDEIKYETESVNCLDDANIIALSQKDDTIKLFKDSHTVSELYSVWDETYEKRFSGDIIFRDDSSAYQLGVKPLRKKDLKDFSDKNKIVNRFEEILRHNNVSDKENAFNRLVALFICKLVDEIQKDINDIVDFQYKVGTDTYESLQDRLQRLHKEGMEKFMKEEIFYVPDNYAEELVQQYTGQKRKNMISQLKQTLRILKFYTNNDFAFKDVHNEELFLQNGKILVEVVQLFENFRIIGSENLQMLGDLFEQLLNKGFKQNEGQFFTPVPITRFIWNSLPIEKILKTDSGLVLPKIIDYACGAGHFLTEGFETISNYIKENSEVDKIDDSFAEKNIFGIEKDYRLARVSKISLFMHGAGEGNVIFGDGLENYPDKNIKPHNFDILVANPPYSVSAFKPHLKIKNNKFSIIDSISNNGSEIETLFVERIAQLLKPNGIAAVILPSSILNKESESFVGARESILQNFKLRSIVLFGSKTFGATNTNTVVLFIEKYNEPPKRVDLIEDGVDAIFEQSDLNGWEDNVIIKQYLKKINVDKKVYDDFISETTKLDNIDDKYFLKYKEAFLALSSTVTKQKRKTFKKLSSAEQNDILTKQYYQYAKKIEREKLKYFSLIYNQRTLIVVSPNDNKEQEKFLGYKWSNRKGQEGIQIIDEGGKLYDSENRISCSKISSLIRNMFYDEEISIENFEEYYYYLNTKDMLNFNDVTFNKAIKTTKTRTLKDDPNLITYYLSDKKTFDLSIGDRVLSEEIIDGGEIPIYSANVFEEFGRINKDKLENYNLPSVIWGIDGDWMVNIIPKNKPFYPTDHCGVLRIKNKEILPEYMMYALQVEGEYERFSRTNRASTQRISSLVIQVPKYDTQVEIIKEIDALNSQIHEQDTKIESYEESIKSKFVEMFEGKNFKYSPINEISNDIFAGGDKPEDFSNFQDENYAYPVFSNGEKNDGLLCFSKHYRVSSKALTISARGTIGYASIRSENFTPVVRLITLIPNENINLIYLKCYIDRLDLQKSGSGAGQLTVPDFKKFNIPVPPKELQDEFAAYVEKIDKLKFECVKKKEKLQIEKNDLIDKYFR